MASTTIRPAVRRRVTDGRPQSRTGELHERPAVHALAAPLPNVSVLHRPRVTDLIERAAAAHRVTLVCGPPGAGKTVACATWAAGSAAAGNIAWLSLDPGDREPSRLWARLAAVLEGVSAVPRDLADELTAAGPQDIPLRLVKAAGRLTAPLTLVIDDLHELAGSAALSDVDLLVRHGPPTLRLLLCGRHPAGLGIARLRVGGQLAEVGAADLACTPEEADRYFAMLGLDLRAADRDELIARTDGWMTGLRLAALRSGRDAAAPVCAISGNDPAVADYLWDEVLAPQPADRRLFLLRTSLADPVSGDLADAITGGSDGAAVLDQLSRENLMIRPVTDDASVAAAWTARAGAGNPAVSTGTVRATAGNPASSAGRAGAGTGTARAGAGNPAVSAGTAGAGAGTALAGGRTAAAGAGNGLGTGEYRYNPLLRDLLRTQLSSELPDEVPLLARRAARWLAAQGRLAEAIASAAQGGDWELATRILTEAGPAIALPGPAAELEPVLATFPASRRSAAAVAATLAAARLRTGDPAAAARHLDDAFGNLDRCPAGQRRVLRPWLQALKLTHAGRQNLADAEQIDESTALADHASATAGSPAEHQATGLLCTALGTARLARGDIAEARGAFGAACSHLAVGRSEFSARARAWQAVAEALHGDLSAASSLITDVRDRVGRTPDPVSARLADLAAAQVSWARDDAQAVRDLLGDDGAWPPPPDPAARLIDGLAASVRARLALGDGDLAAARERAARLRHGRYGGQDPAATLTADPLVAVLDADIALRDNDPASARLAIAQAGDGPGSDRADLLTARARIRLAEGDNHGALAAARPCLDAGASQLTLNGLISALITVSVAHRRLGQAEQAAEHLTRALMLAEPHGACRAFLDGGPAVRSALTVLIRPGSQGAGLSARILQRFDTCPGRVGERPTATAVPLTSSELAVLRFLPSHMTNQEIADALFLSINTVKTHLRSVYRKLGVTTRRHAISRGGRFGLL